MSVVLRQTLPLAGSTRGALPRALMVARTHACPGRKSGRGRETSPDCPEVAYDGLANATTHTRNRVQSFQVRLDGPEALADLGRDLSDQLVQAVDVSQLPRDQEALVRSEPADQAPLQLCELRAHTPSGQLRHAPCVGRAGH